MNNDEQIEEPADITYRYTVYTSHAYLNMKFKSLPCWCQDTISVIAKTS